MWWLSLLPAVAKTIATIHDKHFLAKSRISLKEFLSSSTIWLLLLSIIPALVWGEILKPDHVVTYSTLGIIFIMIITGIVKNITLWSGFRGENLIRYDLAITLEPLATITFAALLLPDERDPRIWIMAAIALAALAYGHLRSGNHITFDKKEKLLLIGIIFVSIESIMIKILLSIFAPVTLYFIRMAILASVFTSVFGFHLHKIRSKYTLGTFRASLLSYIAVLSLFYAYQLFGVTVTSLVMILYPVLTYAGAVRFFQEQQPIRMVLAGIIIILCILYTFIYITPGGLHVG